MSDTAHWLKLLEIQTTRFNKTRDLEFKVSVAIWVALLGAAFALPQVTDSRIGGNSSANELREGIKNFGEESRPDSREHGLPVLVYAYVFVLVALHGVWLFLICRSQIRDSDSIAWFRREAINRLDPSRRQTSDSDTLTLTRCVLACWQRTIVGWEKSGQPSVDPLASFPSVRSCIRRALPRLGVVLSSTYLYWWLCEFGITIVLAILALTLLEQR
jgi:hypothetical protein